MSHPLRRWQPLLRSSPAESGLVPPRPAYGHSKDGHADLKQVLLSLGVSSDGLPLRMGLRDGNTSDSTETPVAIDAGTGTVSSARWQWNTLMGALLSKNSGFSSCTPASWPSKRPRPTAPPKPKRPGASPSPSSALKPDGLPMRPTLRQPSPTLKAE